MSQKLGGILTTMTGNSPIQTVIVIRWENRLPGGNAGMVVRRVQYHGTVYMPWSEEQADSSAYRDTSQITTATEIDRNALNA
jgi:hypothetical protein